MMIPSSPTIDIDQSEPGTPRRRLRATGRSRGAQVGAVAVLVGALAAGFVGLTPDPLEARGFIVSSRFSNRVLEYADDGEFAGAAARGRGLRNPNGIAIGPDGLLYVSNGDMPVVHRFDLESGGFVDLFVADDPDSAEDETGGLVSPRGVAFGPTGDLFVCSGGTGQVLRYDGASGEFIEVFAEHPQLTGPVALAFGPDGDLYVSGATSDRVVAFDGESGVFERILMSDGELSNPTGLAFGRDGTLYVASAVTGRILRFDLVTGNPLAPLPADPELDIPIGLMFHPGTPPVLYVAAFDSDSVRRYDAAGELIDEPVAPGSGGLDGAHYLQFLPRPGVDCGRIRQLRTTCSGAGVLKAKIKSSLPGGTTLTVVDNSTPRWVTLKRNGKGNLRLRGRSGLHGVSLLECPGLERAIDCG